jgi:hypothetical protein
MLVSVPGLSVAVKISPYEATTNIYVTHRSSVPRLSQLVKLLWCELHAYGHAVDRTRSHAWELLRHHLPLLLLMMEHLLLTDSSHCARVVHPNWVAAALVCQIHDEHRCQ